MFRIHMQMLLAAWICCVGVGMADTVLVSDDFNNGAVNSHAALNNRTLNNGLGGMIPNVKWYAPQVESILVNNPNFDSVAMEAHEDRVEMGALGLQNNQAYRLDALVRNISWWNTIIVEANHGSLWQPGGLLVTFTPSTLGGLYWLDGGSAFDNQIATVGLSPADYDADGNVPLSIIYSHENRAIKSALSLWVLANGNRKIAAKVNLDPSGELIGFGGAAGVFMVDNVKVSLTTLPTPDPTPPSLANSEPMHNETMSNVKDYTFGWWMYGWRDSRKVFAFQSNKYALAFDYPSFDLQSLFPIKQPLAEQEAASQANDAVFGDATNKATDIECVLESGSNRYKVTSASSDASNCYLSETGKYFQRRILHQLNLASGAPVADATMEVVGWPDRVAFLLSVSPNQNLTSSAIEVALDFADIYSVSSSQGKAKALAASDGTGFIAFADSPDAVLTSDPANGKFRVRLSATAWKANRQKRVGITIYPIAANVSQALARAVATEENPLNLIAWQRLPTQTILNATYDSAYGWYHIPLRNDGDCQTYSETSNNRIEAVPFRISNPTSVPREVRLDFCKDSEVPCITGLSAIMRDSNQYPCGIPIQISKNWHSNPNWFRGLTMLTVPAGTTLTLEYTGVAAHWGGVPAAAHAQLCLIGYAVNQEWDQASIGSWGESICFDPDVNLNRSMIDDVRPLMVYGPSNSTPTSKWAWTCNVGGGDFLVYYDTDGNKQWASRMRTKFTRYCPNLTEVTYAGMSHDGKIELKNTVSLYRTNDINRGIYHLRYDIKSNVTFNRLAFAQIASDNYDGNQSGHWARGNASGLIEEWAPVQGGLNYSRSRIAEPGSIPWFSMHEAVPWNDPNVAYQGSWANRGVVIRSYRARINGVDNNIPSYSVYGSDNGRPAALWELSVPAGVSQLKAGDYIEAVIEHVIVPQYKNDYYGTNANLAAALTTKQNTWQMIYREAVGNNIGVTMTKGELERSYPIRIKSSDGLNAEFSVSGGLAYVPLTISGLSGFRHPVLEKQMAGSWVQVQQSYWGNDYWQSDYDTKTNTWELTYSIVSDTPGDARQTVEYRFHVLSNDPAKADMGFLMYD